MTSSTMEKKGYKQTELGLIPEDWEVVRLGDVCQKVLGGGTPSTTCEDYWNGSIPWVTSADIVDLRTIEPRRFITEEAIQKSATNLVPKGSIVVATRVGLGKVGINLFDLCTSQDCQSLILDNRKSITEYILYKVYLQAQEFTKQSRGSTIQGITKSQLVEIEIPLPPLEEQKKIAEILNTWDQGIDKLSGLIERKKYLKKGLMQKLLSGRVRLEEFVIKQGFQDTELGLIPEDWEVVRLGDVLTIGGGKDYRHLGKGDIPVFGTGGLMTTVNDFLFDGETVCIGRKGTIDKPFYYEGKIWTVDTLFYTHSFKNTFAKFIYYIFQTINWREYNEASGVPSLSKSIIENIFSVIPPLEEQKKIAEILSTQDKEINDLERKLELFKQQKKGLMQILLTGRVRV